MTEHELIEEYTNRVAEIMADTDVRHGYWRDKLMCDDVTPAQMDIRRGYVRRAVAALSVLAPMLAQRDTQIELLGKACQRDAQGVKDRQVLKVTWHPNAVRQAVDHAVDITQAAESPDAVYRLPGGHLTWMDLACLVDAGRAALTMAAEDGDS